MTNKPKTTEPLPQRREEEFELPEMKRDSNVSQYTDVFFVKPLTKDAAYFEVSKKVGEEYVVNPRKDIQHIGGELIKIDFGSYLYQNNPVKVFKLHIVVPVDDQKYLYIISSSYTTVGRTIINCLLDYHEKVETINITLSFRNGFSNANVSINGNPSIWKSKTSGPGKYTSDELNGYVIPIKHPHTGVLISNDYSKLIEFMEDEIMKHVDVLLPHSQHIKFVDSPLKDVDNSDILDSNDDYPDHKKAEDGMFNNDLDDEEEIETVSKKKK